VVRYFLKINVKMRKKDGYFGHVPDNNPFSDVWKKTIREVLLTAIRGPPFTS
jgi:hypothetical protein